MLHVQAPQAYQAHLSPGRPVIFLAGSIEMGRAEPWQAAFVEALSERDALILNPRRADWDASWAQTIEHPRLREQVEWELQALEDATLILMYLQPGTQSPISMLELGLYARADPHKLIICCPEGFWRKGNIDVTAAKYGVAVVETKAALIAAALARLGAQKPPPASK